MADSSGQAKRQVQDRSKRTPEKEQVLLNALRERPSFAAAARKARIAKSTFIKWRKDDPAFAEACNAAREEGLDALEDAMFERGMEDDTTAAIFMLKSWRPSRYRERIEHTGENGGPLTIIFADREDGPR